MLRPASAIQAEAWSDYPQIIESVSDAVVVADTGLRIRVWNSAATALFGWSAEEVLGAPAQLVRDQLRYLDGSDSWQALDEVLERGGFTREGVVRHRDGSERFVEVAARLLCNSAGSPVAIVALLRDLTARRRAEQELEQILARERAARLEAEAAQRHLALLAEASTLLASTLDYEQAFEAVVRLVVPCFADFCAIDLLDTDGQLRRVVEVCADTVAAHPSQTLTCSCHSIPPSARAHVVLEKCRASFRQYSRLQQVGTYECSRRREQPLEQADRVSEIVVPLVAHERALGVIIIASFGAGRTYTPADLALAEELGRRTAVALENARLYLAAQESMRQKDAALAELSRHQRQLAGIIGSAMDAIITVDKDQRIMLFNAAAERVFRCSASEAIGQPLDRFIPHRHREVHRAHLAHFGASNVTSRSMHATAGLTARRGDGEEFPIEASISQIDVGGEQLFTVILRDITERKKLEAQFLQAQKMESIGRLAGGIAHDFNNLLTAIAGYTELAIDELAPDHVARADLREVQDAIMRATTLTRQLLAFARKQVIEPQAINLNTLIVSIEKLLRRLIGADIELLTLPAPELGMIRGDPGQIEQVLVNLAVNARDAMPDGGKLTIETANVLLDDAYARGHIGVVPGPYVLLAVSDTGMGIPPEVQARLFEPFFTTKAPGQGTGLGLATCYGIVRQHGGNIMIYSEVGRGTTVKIYLPQVGDVVVSSQDVEDQVGLPRGSETVLLVEDDLAVLGLEARLLREQGYTVFEASNGEEALQLLAQSPTISLDLVLTDIVMPQVGGKALVEQIKALYPLVKVLFASGYTDNTVFRYGQLEPGDAFLQKPFTPARLARKVREVLDS